MSKFLAPYITVAEYTCGCGCGLPPAFDDDGTDVPTVYTDLFDDFSLIRGQWGKPIVISSGYRCPQYNKDIGGSRLSVHMFGLALDLDVEPGDVFALDSLIEELTPYLRRGKYTETGSFIHIDNAYEIYPIVSRNWQQGVRWYG